MTTIISTKNNEDFICMHKDAKLLLNMLDQISGKCFESSDYLTPGILAGGTKQEAVKDCATSILNHIKNMEEKGELFT